MLTWTIAQWKELAEAIQAVATTLGLAAAGFWTYSLFVRKRDHVPKAQVTHRIVRLPLPDGREAISIQIDVANIGSCVLPVCDLECRVEEIHLEHGVQYFELDFQHWRFDPGATEIEPGEVSTYDHVCTINPSQRWIYVQTFMVNEMKRPREIGWRQRTLIDRFDVQATPPAFAATTDPELCVTTEAAP